MNKNPEELRRDAEQLTQLLQVAANKYELDRTQLYSIEELVLFIRSLDDDQLKKMMQLIAFCILGFKSTAPPQQT